MAHSSPDERIHEVVLKCNDWYPKTDEEVRIDSLVYRAVSGHLEDLEHAGRYRGNAHHLAQRIAALVVMEMYPRAEGQPDEGGAR